MHEEMNGFQKIGLALMAIGNVATYLAMYGACGYAVIGIFNSYGAIWTVVATPVAFVVALLGSGIAWQIVGRVINIAWCIVAWPFAAIAALLSPPPKSTVEAEVVESTEVEPSVAVVHSRNAET